MSTALAPQNGNLAVVQPQDFTNQQLDLIRHGIVPGANELEFDMFLNLCRAKRLDPLTRQIYGIKTGKGLQMFASIDGLRVIAQRSGQYAGQVGPFWCGEDGKWQDVWLSKDKPAAAKIGVLRTGWTEPMWGVATLKSYGKDSPTWNAMPDVMLAKVAESMALRKAFPDDLSGLYERSEFRDVPEEVEPPQRTNIAPTRQESRPERTSVTAEVVDVARPSANDPREKAADRKKELGEVILELRTRLNWDASRVRAEAEKQQLSLGSVAGLEGMVAVLSKYVLVLEEQDEQAEDEEDYEAYEAQGTLLDAETAPIEREW